MKAVVQRVLDASVSVDGALKSAVASGLLVYLGVAREDTTEDVVWLAEKIPHLRIFDDENGVMNLSLVDIIVNQQKIEVNRAGVNHDKNEVNNSPKGFTQRREDTKDAKEDEMDGEDRELPVCQAGVMVISQFTLLGDVRKGRRPSWGKAAPPEQARELYRCFIEKISEIVPCAGGEFQAHMRVTYTNDGPVTILLDSANII